MADDLTTSAHTSIQHRLSEVENERLNGATHVMQLGKAAELAKRMEQAARGEIPLDLEAVHALLAELKAAIDHHFAQAPPACQMD